MLDFKGRHRDVWGRFYTELFFLEVFRQGLHSCRGRLFGEQVHEFQRYLLYNAAFRPAIGNGQRQLKGVLSAALLSLLTGIQLFEGIGRTKPGRLVFEDQFDEMIVGQILVFLAGRETIKRRLNLTGYTDEEFAEIKAALHEQLDLLQPKSAAPARRAPRNGR